VAPAPPTITLPPADEVTSEASGPLAGGAEANSTVTGYLLGVAAGSTVANASGTWDFFVNDPYAEGTYSLTVTATDAAGNVSLPSAPRVITIDTTAPVVSISAPTADQRTLDPTPNITFSTTDAHLGTTACSLDGGADVPCTSPYTTPTLAEGTHSVTVRHTDQAGNVGSASVSFVVDTISPNVTISAPAQSSTLTTRTPNVVFTVADANPGTITCAVDGGVAAACSSPFTTPSLGDGPHSVTVSATDTAGNVGSAVRSFTIDATLPGAPSITSPATDVTTSANSPAFAGSAEASSTVTIYDGVAVIGTVTAAATGTWSFTPTTPLSDGVHAITVRATDSAGNQGP
ncbi:MAG: Ig-like domain-containing protein, partial [Actinomycetota bacterium]|nr:Ig-like domain-containing protein [Actinomycetota bacterium]